MTLDRNVPLEVPLDDARRAASATAPLLIAFCKAMEFTTLTKRVAEATKTDIDSVAGRRCRAKRRVAAQPKTDRADVTEEARAGAAGLSPVLQRRRQARRRRRRTAPTGPGKRAAEAAAAVAGEAVRPASRTRRSTSIDAARPLDRGGARARPRRHRRRDHLARPDAGASSSASASRPRRARPPTCRSATGTAPATSSAAAWSTGQIPVAGRARAAEAAARGPVGPEDRPEPQVRLRRLRPPRHQRRALSTTRC